ncbi:MAG TPA: serine/threonine-protein kinase [Aggregatilineales bacterium]|nr:serine/threonine-protein kinase [Aggregatilineales bacterium]
MSLREGDPFDHYQIRSHIAQGGMGDIYRALDVLTGREVALKIPDKMMIGDPAQFERFQRELEAMRTLNHPALQHGLESGRFNNTPFLVTELVEGQSLRDLLKVQGPMPVERALALTRRIADAMAYCHEHDVIHRDLKPENILITKDDQPVILDFGLALTKGARRVTYANLSSTAGTPDYMAPEQIEGQRGDKRTDVYAVGTMLYEMIANQPPFTGKDNMAVMAMHLHGAVPRLDKVHPGVSPQVATVVAKCLQRNPDQRYAEMRALIEDLDHLDQVDTSLLETLSAAPPKTPFFKTQLGRVFLTSAALIAGIILLTVLLVALRH